MSRETSVRPWRIYWSHQWMEYWSNAKRKALRQSHPWHDDNLIWQPYVSLTIYG